MSILTLLKEALAPHGYSVRHIPGDELADDCLEILDADQQVTELEVQIYHEGGAVYYVNEWEGDGLITHYSGGVAARAVAVVLERLKVSV